MPFPWLLLPDDVIDGGECNGDTKDTECKPLTDGETAAGELTDVWGEEVAKGPPIPADDKELAEDETAIQYGGGGAGAGGAGGGRIPVPPNRWE